MSAAERKIFWSLWLDEGKRLLLKSRSPTSMNDVPVSPSLLSLVCSLTLELGHGPYGESRTPAHHQAQVEELDASRD